MDRFEWDLTGVCEGDTVFFFFSFLLFLDTVLGEVWGGDFIQIPELSVNSLYHLRAAWPKSPMSVTLYHLLLFHRKFCLALFEHSHPPW